MACRDAGAQLWGRTDLKPADVQLAEMYDGFSFITMAWLEAMGFCGHGESGPFVEGGREHRPRRRCSRSTPTAASSRPAGSTATASSTRRACSSGARRGERQVPGDPEVGVACAGGGPLAGALLARCTSPVA